MNKVRLLWKSCFFYNMSSKSKTEVMELKKAVCIAVSVCILVCITGCGADKASGNIVDIESRKETTESLLQQDEGEENTVQAETQINEPYTTDTKIAEVISDPVFEEHGRLIFPVDSGYYSGDTLGTLRLTWYSNIDPEKTVEIANYLRNCAAAEETTFMIFTLTKKRRLTRQSRTQGCSSSKEIQEKNLLFVMQAGDLRMWGQCRIVFPMRWNYPKWDITPLL